MDAWHIQDRDVRSDLMRLSRLLVLFLGLFLIGLALWTNRYFGHVTVDQALSTVTFSVHGVFVSDSIFIKRFIEWCLFWPLIVTLIIQAICYCVKLISQRFFVSEKKSSRQNCLSRIFSGVVFFIGLGLVIYQYHVSEFVLALFDRSPDVFASLYVDPSKVSLKAKKPKSLVLIYVESLENTYSNSAFFNHDLLARLNSVTATDTHFKQYDQMPGTGWTIAGIVATQCGIPLRMVTIFNGNRIGENINHYLPSATCLSDILASHGYKNIFMNGAALSFSGVDVFLQDHHYNESYGKDEWLKSGVSLSDMQGWGLTDDQLFEKAKIKLAELIRQEQPFSLTILTIDTHGLNGQLNKTCKAKGYQHFSGIVECTANEVADFVAYIKHQGWLDRVNVVIQGDHLAMENDVVNILKSAPNRTIYNAIIAQPALKKNREMVTHYDMLPTILDSLGFQFEGGRLGLGYSAIRDNQISPATRVADVSDLINHKSASYNSLWMYKVHDRGFES